MTTKIHATCDALGNPIGFHLTPGQDCDLEGADHLLDGLQAGVVLADKGYDADERVLEVLAENTLPVEGRVYGVAAVDGRLVMRTGSKVICVGKETSR